MRNYEQSYANLGENEENEERSIKLHSIGRKILGHTTTSQDEETTERGEKNIPTPDDLKVMEQFDLSYEELDWIRGLKIRRSV